MHCSNSSRRLNSISQVIKAKSCYSLHQSFHYKLLGLAHGNWELFTDDSRITVCSRICRISFLQQLTKSNCQRRKNNNRGLIHIKMNAKLAKKINRLYFRDIYTKTTQTKGNVAVMMNVMKLNVK